MLKGICKMKYNRKIIKTNKNSVLYANKYWFVINQSGKVQEDGVDYYILEVTRLTKDYTLFRGSSRNKFIQVCDNEISIMQDPEALMYCDMYNSRKTSLE